MRNTRLIPIIDYQTIVDSSSSEINETESLKLKVIELEKTISEQENTVTVLRKKVAELLDCNDDSPMETPTNFSNNKLSKLTEEDNAYFTGYSHYSIHDIMISERVLLSPICHYLRSNTRRGYRENRVIPEVHRGEWSTILQRQNRPRRRLWYWHSQYVRRSCRRSTCICSRLRRYYL